MEICAYLIPQFPKLFPMILRLNLFLKIMLSVWIVLMQHLKMWKMMMPMITIFVQLLKMTTTVFMQPLKMLIPVITMFMYLWLQEVITMFIQLWLKIQTVFMLICTMLKSVHGASHDENLGFPTALHVVENYDNNIIENNDKMFMESHLQILTVTAFV